MKTVKDGRSAIIRGWTRVVCAFCMQEGTIWAFRFTLFSNQNIFRLFLYKVKRNAHIVPSSMQKARTTLVQPLVMADRPSFTVFMKTSR